MAFTPRTDALVLCRTHDGISTVLAADVLLCVDYLSGQIHPGTSTSVIELRYKEEKAGMTFSVTSETFLKMKSLFQWCYFFLDSLQMSSQLHQTREKQLQNYFTTQTNENCEIRAVIFGEPERSCLDMWKRRLICCFKATGKKTVSANS